jgi:hypothetical protein
MRHPSHQKIRTATRSSKSDVPNIPTKHETLPLQSFPSPSLGIGGAP